MKIVKEFNYSISPVKMLLPLLMFGACAAFFFREAITNDRGLIINGIFRLDTQGGTIFYYVMAGLSCLFVLGAIWAIINGLTVKQKLVIYSDGLGLPLKKETVRLYFSDIVSAQMLEIYSTRMIEFAVKDGKKYSIPDSKLGTKAELDEVLAFITRGISNKQVQ
jgi:hypothetical protein